MRILAWIRQGGPFTFYAHCPSLPGCAVTAASAEQAQDLILQMVQSYLCSYNVAPAGGLKVEFRWSGGGILGERPLSMEGLDGRSPVASA